MCVYVYGYVPVSNKNVNITLTRERYFASIAICYRRMLKRRITKLKWGQLYSVKPDSLVLLGFSDSSCTFLHLLLCLKITS